MRVDRNAVHANKVLETFISDCKKIPAPRALELGSKRSFLNRSTMHYDYVPHAREYLGFDIQFGLDVDIVGDIHRLSRFVGEESFDVIICCSTFGNLKYPHIAAYEIMKSLTIGGLLFIQTHQSYLLFPDPVDYFRFSMEGLSSLFGSQNGFETLGVNNEFPVSIHAPQHPELTKMEAYLHTTLYGIKRKRTPRKYVYELDYRG
jgi:hypothetical protein